MRTKMDKILGLLAPKDKAALAEMLKNKEGADKIRAYLKKMEEVLSKKKVTASVNPDHYQWMRFKGKVSKSIPYAGMIVHLEPETVIGFAKEMDSIGKCKVIIPVFKRAPISLEPDIVNLIKARCKPFTGKAQKYLVRKAEAAVKDIPAGLKEILEKDAGMKTFLSQVNKFFRKDLNALEMGPSVFTKGTRIKTSEIENLAKDPNKVLIIQYSPILEKSQNYQGWADNTGIIYSLGNGRLQGMSDKKYFYEVLIPSLGKVLDIEKPRNLISMLNSGDFDWKSWIIDLSKAKDTSELVKKRLDAQQGILKRFETSVGYHQHLDKSGYPVDRDKYTKMLKELKQAGNQYIDAIYKISNRMFEALKVLGQKKVNPYKYTLILQEAMNANKYALDVSVSTSSYNTSSDVNKYISRFEAEVKKLEDLAKNS